MKNLTKTLLAGFLCLTLPVWGAYAAVPDFHPVFNGGPSFLPPEETSEGGLSLSDLKFVQQEPEILSPEFLDSLLGLSAPEEATVLQNIEEQLTDELYGAQGGKPFWLNGKVLVISGIVILLSGLAVLIGILAGSGGGSGSGAQGFSGGGGSAPENFQSNTGPEDGDGTGEGGNNGNNSNNPDPNGNGNPPPVGGGSGGSGGGTGGGTGGAAGGGGGLPGDGGGLPGDGGNRSFPPHAPNNPEPGTMMLMLLGFCFPLLRKRFS